MEKMIEKQNRAQQSRAAIERIYVAMRHLFIRGSYKPMGISGESLMESILTLSPEIYGSVADKERIELDGLLYIFQRLPQGIEECRFIRLISREGYETSHFTPLIPPKRRRNCYRIDDEQMFIEMTRGRSDVYDVLTHLTFLYNEAEKIKKNSTDYKGRRKREWDKLEEVVMSESRGLEFNKEIAYTYLSTLLNRNYDEIVKACDKFEEAEKVNSLFYITYWLGKRAMEETDEGKDREISFSTSLREKIGHHIYGEAWAQNIKKHLFDHKLIQRPIHIISANLHSVVNTLYAKAVFPSEFKNKKLEAVAVELAKASNKKMNEKIIEHAKKNGLILVEDTAGTNIGVQIIDCHKLNPALLTEEIKFKPAQRVEDSPVIIIMDYAFGEQAYETMDELLKPYLTHEGKYPLQVKSISIMGKAGILTGEKGDIIIAQSHVFEGTADNYPVKNAFKKEDFEGQGIQVFEGSMITVLGTSLQNRDILKYFLQSSWNAVGLEMEGAHYQKAIQAASQIRNNISSEVVLRYAYYASDNPLISGQTLASGSLGTEGVKPTYLITQGILNGIFSDS
jgi:hypothetical protein